MLARQIATLLLPPIVPAFFARLRPAERSYLGPHWPARANEKWDERSQAEVTCRNWPTVAARVAGTGLSTCCHVVVQRLRRAGFGGEFVSHVVNRDEFLEHALAQKLVLVRELMAWGTVRYRGAPEDTTGAGFLFERPSKAGALSQA